MRLRKFLSFRHFVAPGAGRIALPSAGLPLVCALLMLGSCAPRVPRNTTEDSPTSGRISIVVTPDLRSLFDREVEAFQALYPQARIEIRQGRSSEGVAALLDATASLAVIPREMLPEEKVAAQSGRIEVEGYLFARDALVMVANPSARVENVTVDEIAAIYRGEVTSWRALGGADQRIVPVVEAVTSDRTLAFVEQALGGDTLRAPSHLAENDTAAAEFVARTPGALAYVSLGTPTEGLTVLRVSKLTGMSYVSPDPQNVHEGAYPLSLPLNLYVRTQGPRLAHGFITFVTSREGQSLVHEKGRVPTAVPIRFVRRSPLQSTH